MAVNKSEKGESIATETLELLERIKTDKRPRWRDQIIKINAPLVEKIAREYSTHIPNTVAELEDLRQLCLIGVSRAIDNDHKRQGNFSAFARMYMVEEMRRYRRSHWGIPRVWLEARDTVQTRKRLYEKLTGREISEEFVATQSMGISAELWQEIITGYWQHATDSFGSAFDSRWRLPI